MNLHPDLFPLASLLQRMPLAPYPFHADAESDDDNHDDEYWAAARYR